MFKFSVTLAMFLALLPKAASSADVNTGLVAESVSMVRLAGYDVNNVRLPLFAYSEHDALRGRERVVARARAVQLCSELGLAMTYFAILEKSSGNAVKMSAPTEGLPPMASVVRLRQKWYPWEYRDYSDGIFTTILCQ